MSERVGAYPRDGSPPSAETVSLIMAKFWCSGGKVSKTSKISSSKIRVNWKGGGQANNFLSRHSSASATPTLQTRHRLASGFVTLCPFIRLSLSSERSLWSQKFMTSSTRRNPAATRRPRWQTRIRRLQHYDRPQSYWFIVLQIAHISLLYMKLVDNSTNIVLYSQQASSRLQILRSMKKQLNNITKNSVQSDVIIAL